MYIAHRCLCLFFIKLRWPKNKSLEEHFTFHLQYKHSGTFANRKYEELSYPKNQKMCDPILVTLLKMRPHYNQSSRENATPSSGTSPLASCQEVYLRVLFRQWLTFRQTVSGSHLHSQSELYHNLIDKSGQLPDFNTINWSYTTHSDSENDYWTGCRNVSHCQQQSCWGLRLPRRSWSTYSYSGNNS